jgi:flagellin
MSLNSVNTNTGAMILQSLNRTNESLASTQKRISTGSRVADSTDDGAVYAVAQSVCSSIGGLTTANQQLGNVQGLLSTTQSGLNDISNTMASMRNVLVTLADANVQGNQRTQYQAQYKSLLANVKSFIQDNAYNGKTLIGSFSAANGQQGVWAKVNTVRNEIGATYGVATYNASAMYAALTHFGTALMTSGSVALAISATGTFLAQMNNVGGALNTVGAEVNYVSNQLKYNSNKIDALNTGLGSLVDADLAKESAQLQALQIRQQLGTQALSLANQAPQTLLSLFK